MFIAMAGAQKAIVSFHVGKRDTDNTDQFIRDLRERIIGLPEISTDGFHPYRNAIRDAFGNRVAHGIVSKTYSVTHLNVNEASRRYSPASVIAVAHDVVSGVPAQISTSYAERGNLSLRMACRRFTRLTNGFSKKLECHIPVPPRHEIDERTQLLREHAQELIESNVLPGDRVDMRGGRFPYISEGYFLLNRAYKDWRMPDGHYTERPKIAALQCVTISRYQPFFPLKVPVDEADISVVKCNEIFALSYALGILEINFELDTDERIDFWLRLLDVIAAASCQTLEAYSVDRSLGIEHTLEHYDHLITEIHHDDKGIINALISIFELMSEKGKTLLYKSSSTAKPTA